MARKRKNFSNEFKWKVAIEAIKGNHTLAEMTKLYQLHPNQISQWKRQALEHGPEIFNGQRGPKKSENEADVEKLFQQIGELQYQLTWLKKKYESIS